MEFFKDMKKSTKIGLIISIVLCVFVFINAVISGIPLLNQGNIRRALYMIIDLGMVVAIMCYLLFGYKKPHGNMLRFIFFIFAIYLDFGAALILSGPSHSYIDASFRLLAALIIAYISGRLNKIEKNRVLLIFAGVLLLADEISLIATQGASLSFMIIISKAVPMILLAALGFAYAARYEQHKEAGLEDNK